MTPEVLRSLGLEHCKKKMEGDDCCYEKCETKMAVRGEEKERHDKREKGKYVSSVSQDKLKMKPSKWPLSALSFIDRG